MGEQVKLFMLMKCSSKTSLAGHVLTTFLLQYDQVCDQRGSRDVVGLMQSWSGLLQQTVWFRVSFFFWKMSVKQKQSQSSNSAMPVRSEESLEQRLKPASVTLKVNAQPCQTVESISHEV